MRIAHLIIATSLALSAQSALAQESGTGSTTGSGSIPPVNTVQKTFGDIVAMAPGRLARNLKQLQVPEKILTAWQNDVTTARKRMADLRAECREAVRRANRDERMNKILQCERSLLLQEAGLLNKETQYINAIPLLDGLIKASATGAIANLENAQMAIIDGIDAGIFVSDEQLLTARHNLQTTYRQPYWAAKQRLRADRELTYIAFVSKKILEREDVSTNDLIIPIATCLDSAATHLLAAKTTEDTTLQTSEMALARADSLMCRTAITTLAKADRQAATDEAK